MISFFFTINKSFLEYPNHPITIPCANYPDLISSIYQGKGRRTIPILIDPPTKRILDGEIYFGISSYGEYYQIKVLGKYPSVYFGNLKIGDTVLVVIKRMGEKINVAIIASDELRDKLDNILSPSKKLS
jgi:hypothetical protein